MARHDRDCAEWDSKVVGIKLIQKCVCDQMQFCKTRRIQLCKNELHFRGEITKAETDTKKQNKLHALGSLVFSISCHVGQEQ